MIIKSLIDEDFINYKKPSMFIAFPNCGFKCDFECGQAVCQNSSLAREPNIEISKEAVVERYLKNPISQAFVFGGMEPFDSLESLVPLINCIRNKYNCNDDIVIYTGYSEAELKFDEELPQHSHYKYICESFSNIIIKYGRFIPNCEEHYDEVLGVILKSPNQYAKRATKGDIMTIKLNPDEEFVKEFKIALKENAGYCPCRKEKTPDTKCMCKEFREMEEGQCHCGLYIKSR